MEEVWKELRDVVYSTAAEQLGHTTRKQQNCFDENDEEIQGPLNSKHNFHRAHQNNSPSISKKAALNFIEMHADMVSELGQTIRNTKRELEDQQSLELLMQKQRESISGVSIDEEMTQLVRYQRAFEASAKLIGIVDEMLGTVLSMSR